MIGVGSLEGKAATTTQSAGNSRVSACGAQEQMPQEGHDTAHHKAGDNRDVHGEALADIQPRRRLRLDAHAM